MFSYQKVGSGETEATGESTEHTVPLLDDDKNDIEGGGRTACNVERWMLVFRRPFTLLCMSLCFFILSGMFYSVRYYLAVTDASCQRRMWPYSPEVDFLEYESRQYQSDLISHEFVGVPTKERRDAWDDLWKTGRIGFPYEKLGLINKSTEAFEWWTLPQPRDKDVIAMSEGNVRIDVLPVMHQVHCVGVLWLFAHRNEWDFRTIMNKTDDFMKIHSRHCSVVLMKMIMCMADVTPVLFQRDNGNPISGSGLGEWKTKDAPRRCKKFDKLWEWEKQNSICPMACLPEDIARLYPGSNQALE
ncbi:hypothetical protein BKA64DRAFT_586817 [Cadophora sp. MPI-SDFR-AT-0126]|nr:hypothetical protein BKA64DRAFT_586817 [Leotiomycetes sp. MPI-SDFR-AT-0126]